MIDLTSSVAICAMSKSGQIRDLSDYGTVIGINNTHAHIKRVEPDLIVAMDDLERDVKTEPEYVDAIVNYGVPVLSTRSFKKWSRVEPFPIKQVVKFLESKFPIPAYKLLDNSICYSLALCLSQGVERIGLSGIDLTAQYRDVDLECARIRWDYKGYAHAPDWFVHYDNDVLIWRRAREPGWESIHALIGWAMGQGVHFDWTEDSTLFNTDRDRFFYGYGEKEQPK